MSLVDAMVTTDTERSIDLLLPAGWLDVASFEDVELRQVGDTDNT